MKEGMKGWVMLVACEVQLIYCLPQPCAGSNNAHNKLLTSLFGLNKHGIVKRRWKDGHCWLLTVMLPLPSGGGLDLRTKTSRGLQGLHKILEGDQSQVINIDGLV